MYKPGELIDDRYLLVRPLGRRGGAEIWEAEHDLVGHKVAIKMLSSDVVLDDQARDGFLREARAAAQIAHPSAIEVYDLGVTPSGTAYIVSEPLRGETLTDFLRRTGRLPPEDACQIMLQILDGLQAAHLVGLSHRTLCPSSVVLRKDKRGHLVVKILDFGMGEARPEDSDSSEVEKLPVEKLPVSVVAYMAPELALGHPADERADLFSAGAILFEMLAGRPPFRGKSAEAVITASSAGRYDSLRMHLPDLAPALERLIDQALAPSPLRRISSASELHSLLVPFADIERPASLRPRDTMMPFLSPDARRSRGLARLERAVMGVAPSTPDSVRPHGRVNLTLVGGQAVADDVQDCEDDANHYPMSGETPLSEQELMQPRIPKAPRAPRYSPSHKPPRGDERRPPTSASIHRGARPRKPQRRPSRSSDPRPSQVAPIPQREEPQPMVSRRPSFMQKWTPLLVAAGIAAGLLLGRILPF